MDEGLNCRREEGNISDPYAVAIIKCGKIMGHVSCRISAACNLFIQNSSVIIFLIAALSSGVYQFYFPQLAVVAVNTFPTHAFTVLSSSLDNEGMLVGSTTDKLEGKLGLFLSCTKSTSARIFCSQLDTYHGFMDFNFTVLSLTVKQ